MTIGWFGNEPKPYESALDISYIDSEGEKIENDNYNKTKQGVNVPFQALYNSLKVDSFTVKASAERAISDFKGIHIKIDDSFYGPYTDIKVSPLSLGNSGNHLFLPLMCYMPGSEI